jgi:hypothetical protein
MKTYPIPENLLNAILNILATLPWRQVNQVMAPLQQIINQADIMPPINGDGKDHDNVRG